MSPRRIIDPLTDTTPIAMTAGELRNLIRDELLRFAVIFRRNEKKRPKRLTVNEVAKDIARCGPDHVRVAILGGALPAVDRGAGKTAGSTARFLIREDDAEAWVDAGCPVAPMR